jgi:hypothetical protein
MVERTGHEADDDLAILSVCRFVAKPPGRRYEPFGPAVPPSDTEG